MVRRKKKVLLTSGQYISTISLGKQFAYKGYDVFVTDTTRLCISRRSNVFKGKLLIPSPSLQTEQFIEKMIAIVNEKKIDHLIPVGEEIFYLSKYRHLFPKHCSLFLSDFDKLHSLHNKWMFNEKLKSLGLFFPKSYLIRSLKDLKSIPLKFPFIIKKIYSTDSLAVKEVDSFSPFLNMTFDPLNPWLVQEKIKGKTFFSFSLVHNGIISAHAVYPKKHTKNGKELYPCRFYKAIAHGKIFDWVKNFVEKEAFTGQIGFDFIEKQDGTLCALECNPRSTPGIFLFEKSQNLIPAYIDNGNPLAEPTYGLSVQRLSDMIKIAGKNLGKKDFFCDLLTTRDLMFSYKDMLPFLCDFFNLKKVPYKDYYFLPKKFNDHL